MTWTLIKSSFNEKIFKISYFILFALPLIVEIVNYVNAKLGSEYKIPISFMLLFSSSLLLLISYVIFKSCCPSIVQKYSDVNAFIDAEQEKKEKAFPDKKVEIVVAHLSRSQNESLNKILDLDKRIRQETDETKKINLKSELDKIVEPLFPGCIQRYLIKEWEIAERQKWIARGACVLLNLISAGAVISIYVIRVAKVYDYTF